MSRSRGYAVEVKHRDGYDDYTPATPQDKILLAYQLAGIQDIYINRSMPMFYDELIEFIDKKPYQLAEIILKNNYINRGK